MNKELSIMKNSEQAIEHKIDSALEIASTAIRRTSMFMSYGLNTVSEIGPEALGLAGFIQPISRTSELSIREKNDFKISYENWIVANGFRNLHEGLEVFLNTLFRVISEAERSVARPSNEKRLKKFERKGVSGKLIELEKYCSFTTNFSHYFCSLSQVRNCITHRQGVVGEPDVGAGNSLKLIWLGVEAEVSGENGIRPITIDTLGPLSFSNLSNVSVNLTMTYVDKHLEFNLGDQIAIPPRNVQEICSMSEYLCFRLRQFVLNWLLSIGVTVNGGRLVADPIVALGVESTGIDNAIV